MKSLLLVAVVSISITAFSQDAIVTTMYFDKVSVSHKINLVMREGQSESVKLKFKGVDREEIIVEVKGDKLSIYLKDAKYFASSRWNDDEEDEYIRERYRDAEITAYVTYRELKKLEVRGDQNVRCESPILADKFRIKAYGDNTLQFFALDTKRLKVSLYGDNVLRIDNGGTGHQKYSLYGDNRVEASSFISQTTKTNIYGDGTIRVKTYDEIKVNSFGSGDIVVKGSPVVRRGLVFGDVSIVNR